MIPVNEPILDGNEKKYLIECIDTGWISSEGPFIKKLEEGMARFVGRKHGMAVCNGTVAIDLALKAIDLKPGDEVILPSLTIISCVSPIVQLGGVPVVVDSDPTTWNMRADQVEAKITPRTKAIMVVHIYGLPVDMDPILKLAAKHGLAVIEDAAESHGLTYKGKPCGSFGDVSTFSFYPNKHVTTGEGGMVVADDPKLAERVRYYRNLCLGVGPSRFKHEDLGWNYRMSNLQAAIGVAQLERLPEFIEKKRKMGATYQRLLKGVKGIQLPLAKTDYADNIYWVFGVVLDDSIPFDAWEAIRRMEKLDVACRPFFWPIHEQPVLMKRGFFKGDEAPTASRLARRGFYVPSGLAITEAQQAKVAEAVKELLR